MWPADNSNNYSHKSNNDINQGYLSSQGVLMKLERSSPKKMCTGKKPFDGKLAVLLFISTTATGVIGIAVGASNYLFGSSTAVAGVYSFINRS
jgi:hypothetical protein